MTINKKEKKCLMEKSQLYIKEYKIYKKHSNNLKKIRKRFEEEGYPFNNMDDIENILILLKGEEKSSSFIDEDNEHPKKERYPKHSKDLTF